jgi:hypothetical protein
LLREIQEREDERITAAKMGELFVCLLRENFSEVCKAWQAKQLTLIQAAQGPEFTRCIYGKARKRGNKGGVKEQRVFLKGYFCKL